MLLNTVTHSHSQISPLAKGQQNAYNVNFCLSLTKFLQPLNLAIFLTLSLFNLLAVPAPHLLSLSRPPTISSLKITDRSFSYASPRLWNQLTDSFRQPHHSCLDSHLHPLINSSLSSFPLSSSITFHSFTPSSKPTFSTNPSHRRFLLPTGLHHDNGTGLDLSCSSFYF